MPNKPIIPTTCVGCGKEFLAPKPASTRSPQRYCSIPCRADHKAVPLMDKFWSRFERGDGCWLWTAGKTRAGYGFLGDRGKPVYAHRLSWEVHRGPIPPNTEVCHDCPGGDNPACVNPDHLFLGSHADNLADMGAKGRRDTSGLGPHPGESHPGAKLTEADVRAIRARVAGGESHYALARAFDVSRPTITAVITRRHWSHVD
jgi:hypothetical protein